MTQQVDQAYFEDILQHLQQTHGFDFTAYKRTTLRRRVLRRMQAVGIESFEEYIEYLKVHQDEFPALLNTILINVTSFFRDREVWDVLREQLLPAILAERQDKIVRIWSAGCAAGHEPYTIAMLLAEQVGAGVLHQRVKIYATDVDEEALAQARAAVYPARQMADVPADLVEKYFESVGATYAISRDLRRAVIFGRHDLIQDSPISRVDLLICRNTLMYFHTEAQARILGRFYFSTHAGGYLLLGRAEMLFSHAAMFAAIDLKRRLFRAVLRTTRDRSLVLVQTGRETMTNNPSTQARLREAAFETDAMPQIVLDAARTLVAANGPARKQFGLTERDAGRPLQDFEISYRPADLRSAVDSASDEGREVAIRDVRWDTGSGIRYFDITVLPLFDTDRALLGARITFRDTTALKLLEAELQQSKQELETAYEELQSTNEELETTNEELQSTVEELETTNEELQSTNEELETMNEELQSTNEELQTMNDELRTSSTDLNTANSFLESVFGSLRSAVVVLDRDYRVQVWTERATDLWGLRADEVQGEHFLGLDIGLPVSELRQPVRDALAGDGNNHEIVLAATNRRGRNIDCRVSVAALRQGDETVRGVILLMEEADGVRRS